jgi:hypothetical protein
MARVVDIEQAVLAVIVVAELAVEGQVAVVVVGAADATAPRLRMAIHMSKSELHSSPRLSLLPWVTTLFGNAREHPWFPSR